MDQTAPSLGRTLDIIDA